MTAQLRAVLWDLDGTLIDSEPYWMRAEIDVAAANGVSWTLEQARSMVGSPVIETSRALHRAGVALMPERILPILLDVLDQRYHMDGVPWRSGVRELVLSLRAAGISNVIVSMSHRGHVEQVVADAPGCFDAFVSGDQVERGKPHPDAYLRALDLAGVPAEQALAVEDSPKGVASALAAGVGVLGVPGVLAIDSVPGVHVGGRVEELSLQDLVRMHKDLRVR